MRREYVIMAVTNDVYEFPIRQYDTIKQMAKDLHLSYDYCNRMIAKDKVYKKLKCKFIRVYLDEKNSRELAKEMLDCYSLTDAKEMLSTMSNEVRENLIVEIWRTYHKLTALAKEV